MRVFDPPKDAGRRTCLSTALVKLGPRPDLHVQGVALLLRMLIFATRDPRAREEEERDPQHRGRERSHPDAPNVQIMHLVAAGLSGRVFVKEACTPPDQLGRSTN